MSPKVLLNRLYTYKHNNLCQVRHKIIAITINKLVSGEAINTNFKGPGWLNELGS